MDPQSLTILVGAFQRILSILIGGMLIYFGYRLFLSLPGKRGRDGGTGEFSLGGANKVKLSKVGPGVFFAIFGAGLIAYSFAKPMKVNIPGAPPASPTTASSPNPSSAPSAATGPMATSGFSYVGAVSAPQSDEERARIRTETKEDIIVLNRALDRANASERPQVERAVVSGPRSRLWNRSGPMIGATSPISVNGSQRAAAHRARCNPQSISFSRNSRHAEMFAVIAFALL
jgi:hypothetical protein